MDIEVDMTEQQRADMGGVQWTGPGSVTAVRYSLASVG